MAWDDTQTAVSSIAYTDWNTMVAFIKSPTLISPTVDHTYSGDNRIGTAGENLVIGDICYLKSDGKFWKADSDAEATTKGMIAMSTGTINTDATGTFLLYGFIRDDTWAWTVGAKLFINPTPGNATATQPSTTGQQIRIIGYAYSSTIIFFNPDNVYIEVA